MIKYATTLLNIVVPEFIKNKIYAYRNEKRIRESRINRRERVREWEAKGKPVPTPHEIKQIIIEDVQALSGYSTLIETGTYMGDMIEIQRPNFKRLYSIELSETLWKRAVKRFRKYPQVTILQGDSGKLLPTITDKLSEPAIFWLDGHYSAGDTALGEKECPIFEEIDSIFKNDTHLKHILLVDDARLFVGKNDYPRVDELTAYIQKRKPGYQLSVKDDVLVYQVL
jgi:hypothetical protein